MRGLIAVLSIGCVVDRPRDGIAVGNPPQARVSVALAADDVSFTSLALPVVGLYLETCGEAAEVRDIDAQVLGLGDPIALDEGRYCGLGLVPSADVPTVLEGTAADGTWTFTQPLGRILLYDDAGVALAEDDQLLLELAEPGWIDAAAFGLAPGEHREIGNTDRCTVDPLCARIAAALSDQAGLYVDDDEDGALDDDERERGEAASGEDRGR